MTHENKTIVSKWTIIGAVAVISLAASSAFAQPSGGPSADPMAAYKTEKGLVSLTKAAPELTPVSEYDGDFWSRSTMFDDPDGLRSSLYNDGFTLDAQLTQVFQGVVSGGGKNGKGQGSYNGLFESNLTVDTAKAGLWSGGLFMFTEQTGFGDPLTNEPGGLSPVNATALWPKANETSSELMEYHLIQALPLNTLLIIGRIDPSNYLDQNSFSCTSDSQFLNVSMNSDPLFGKFLTYSTYGAIFMTKLTDELTLAYGAWTPNTAPGKYGGDWDDYGAALYPIYKYKAFDHPGMLQVIFAYSTKDSADVGNPRLLPGLVSGDLPTKNSNRIFELSGEQYFWEPEGATVARGEGGRKEEFRVATKDYAADRPGMGVFYRFSLTPEDRNAFNTYLSGGIGGRGMIPGRPYDRFGVGSYWLKESNDLDSQPGNVVGDEVGGEVFYNLAITPFVQLSFDAQWISQAINSSDSAVVLGTRLNTRF